MTKMFFVSLLIGGCMSIITPAGAQVVTYPAPQGASLSHDYTVTVDDKPVDVYRGVVREDYALSYGGAYSFAYLDMSAPVKVKVTSNAKPLAKVAILPESSGVKFAVSDNTMTFTLRRPCQLSIEPDRKNGPLLLFANPLEEHVPKPGDPGVKYFAPGIHEAGAIELHDNDTLYIAGGAVVRGGVNAKGKNITIRGRGILDGITWPRGKGPTRNIMRLGDCDGVTVEGIIIKDGWMWNFNMTGSRNITVRNVKVIGSRCENNDGIDICNCKDVVIEDTFVRSDDDCVAPKGMDYANRQAVENLTMRHCVLWTDKANVFRLACESRAEAMRNFQFSDIDVIHFSDRWGTGFDVNCITLQPGEEMPMENIRFEDIRIHCAKEPCFGAPVGAGTGKKVLIEVRPQFSQWNKLQAPGRYVRNCTFKNISVSGEDACRWGIVSVVGPDEAHPVENITFDNITRWGVPMQWGDPGVTVKGVAHDVRFLTPKPVTATPRITPTPALLFPDRVKISMACDTPGAVIHYTTDGSEPITTSPRYSQPFTVTEPCVIKARAVKTGCAAGYTATTPVLAFLPAETVAGNLLNGLKRHIYTGNWRFVPDFSTLTPSASDVTTVINADRVDWDFALLFTGYLKVPVDGVYNISALSDAGTRVTISNTRVIDCEEAHDLAEYGGDIALRAGYHPIRIEFSRGWGGKHLTLFWEGPRLSKQPITAEVLFCTENN